MAERRKNKKKKEIDVKVDDKPSKEEYAIAKYLKQTLPEKKTTLLGHKVEYFIASKAVDCLGESQWAKENKKGELNFSNRDIAVDFMAKLLEHKFFHRAKKIVVQKEPKKKKKETEETAQDSGKEKESKKKKKDAEETVQESGKEKESKKKKKEAEETIQESGKEKESKKSEKKSKTESVEKTDEKDTKKESGEVVEKKKEKKKIKLDMHLEQIFIDSNEPYVWIYDPIPLKTWITGTLMVIAAVLLCLFPLWPQTIRHYIYYLSVAAAFFLVFIIGLAVLRLVVFVLLWVLTFGKHHLWLLPNLTEDVGFFESFWPLYHYEYKGLKTKEKDTKSSDSKDKCHKKKEKESSEKEEEKVEEIEEESQGEESHNKKEKDPDQSQSESDQEKSESETQNGFEFLEADDVSESPGEEEDRKTK